MKTRESGMPDEKMWDTFFEPEVILDSLGIKNLTGNIADLGCGYGTFTIPIAKRTKGKVYAIDIEKDMVRVTKERVKQSGLRNVKIIQRDFMTDGTGLADSCCDLVMLFNILHAEEPLNILAETKRILTSEGKVAIIHWIPDPATPRGPPMSIRPHPEQIQDWLKKAGFILKNKIIPLPPYHYGILGINPV